MRGINGIASRNAGEGEAIECEVCCINQALVPLGPDGGGIYIVDPMGLGQLRLAAHRVKAMAGRRAASRRRARFLRNCAIWLRRDLGRAYCNDLVALIMAWHGGNLDAHMRAQINDYGFNQTLKNGDASSLIQGIAIRCAFADDRLMEFAFELPDEDKFSGGVTKKILREAFDARLPASIMPCRTTIGFAPRAVGSLQGPVIQGLIHDLAQASSFRPRSLLQARKVANFLRGSFNAGRAAAACRFLREARCLDVIQVDHV